MNIAVASVLNFAWLFLIWLIAWRLKRIADALVKLNTGRDAFYAEALEVLSDAKTSGEPHASGTDATPVKSGWCAVCGRAIGGVTCETVGTPLSRKQWASHRDALAGRVRADGANEHMAMAYATDKMYEVFGPYLPGTDAPEEGG